MSSTITLPDGAERYFRNGRFTGSEHTALDGIRMVGARHSFRESGAWHVVCTITANGQSFESDPKPSRAEAVKNAVEKVYAAATARVNAQSPTRATSEADAFLSRNGVDLSNPEEVLNAANLAAQVLARLVEAGRRFV